MEVVSRAIVYSNIHIAIVAAGLIVGTWSWLSISFSWPVLGLACAGAFLIYHLDRTRIYGNEDLVNQPERLVWYKKHPMYVRIGGAASLVTTLICAALLPGRVVSWGLLLGVGAMFYLIVDRTWSRRLKSNWWLKPLLIALGWVTGGVLFPALMVGSSALIGAVGLAAYRMPLLVSNVLVADWPDRRGDAVHALNSLAVRLHRKTFQRVVIGLAIVSFGLGILHGFRLNWPSFYLFDLAGPLFMISLTFYLNSLPRWFLAFAADMVIAWPLLPGTFAAILSTD